MDWIVVMQMGLIKVVILANYSKQFPALIMQKLKNKPDIALIILCNGPMTFIERRSQGHRHADSIVNSL